MHKVNSLIHASSPYLLQHAYNPVNWYPWNEETLQKAIDEDKLILVSIGYSACHWCHVMEHESFEDDDVAAIMNQHFVCIKVDREERPDVDQVYMSAVQLMTGRGGWPLNCFTLPDGRPVYGGTYFPKNQWMNILSNLADLYKNEKLKLHDYATQLTEGILKMEKVIAVSEAIEFNNHIPEKAISNWKLSMDNVEGGPSRAPKFPLPNNYIFLLRNAFIRNDRELMEHVELTLKKMAFGGIYDQIGGGFARYSVDGIWKVPHFEKMLYDNAQLISLYASAFRYSKNPLYKKVVYQTLDFIERELTGPDGNYYSALDADSEGMEGKYYIWKKNELENLFIDDFKLFSEYYNINDRGYWEHDYYILLRHDDDAAIAARYQLTENELIQKIDSFNATLLSERNKRIRPGLDDKTLLSWNALMITGYLDAYDAFSDEKFLLNARRAMDFVVKNMIRDDGGLNHNYKNGVSNINGYLEDYAFMIQALMRMYQCTFEMNWLERAKALLEYSNDHFSDDVSGMYFFTSDIDTPLIARKMELQDNVIPASNSQMALNLFMLGNYFGKNEWIERSKKMCFTMKDSLIDYGSAYSNWLMLWMQLSATLKEVVICGDEALLFRKKLSTEYLSPGIIIAGAISESTLPLTKDRIPDSGTKIYVCLDHTCKLPVNSVSEALSQILS